jgi:hypothetical protein
VGRAVRSAPPADAPAYLLAMRGHFCSLPIFVTLFSKEHHECGTVGTLQISATLNPQDPSRDGRI